MGLGHEPTGYSDKTRDETVSSLTLDESAMKDQDLSAPDDVVVDNLADVPAGAPYRDRKAAEAGDTGAIESGTDIGNPVEPEGSGSNDE